MGVRRETTADVGEKDDREPPVDTTDCRTAACVITLTPRRRHARVGTIPCHSPTRAARARLHRSSTPPAEISKNIKSREPNPSVCVCDRFGELGISLVSAPLCAVSGSVPRA